MIETVKDMSFYLNIPANSCLPFPGLDRSYDRLIPLFDKKESITIDFDKFQAKYGFI
jgi:hypothetical protein